jgi:prolyl 4-hydroxylase
MDCAKKDWKQHKSKCLHTNNSTTTKSLPTSSSSTNHLSKLALIGTLITIVIAIVINIFWKRWQLGKIMFGQRSSPFNDPNFNRPVLPPPGPRLTKKEIIQRAKLQPCKDRKSLNECATMAAQGACHESPGWMSVFCAASCARCEWLNPKIRCDPKNIGIEPKDAIGPGDLRRLFDNLPNKGYKVDYTSRDPPLVVIDNFVTDVEIKRLLELTDKNLHRSTDQGEFDPNGVQAQVVSQGRTSYNAWCMNECEQDPIVAKLIWRISEYVEVPPLNFESFQVLRYRKGEKYDVHHDASPTDVDMPAGYRILTFFIYLSDVEAGGETAFPNLNITIKPKKGSVALWPSVDVDDPTKIDYRFQHAALPVINGTKRAANTWIHIRDYKTNNVQGCTGSFDE